MGRNKPGKPHRPRPRQDDPGPGEVWIQSDRGADGRYFISLNVGADTAYALPPDEALRYARTLSIAIARAEHDAAVLTMFVNRLNMPVELAGQFLARDVRMDRPPIEQIGPLAFDVGVSAPKTAGEKFRPWLYVRHKGEELGHWEVEDAREHLNTVLELAEVTELDDALFRVLRDTVNVEERVARGVIHDLFEYRL